MIPNLDTNGLLSPKPIVEPARKPRFWGDRVLWILYFLFIGISILFIFSASSMLAYQGASMYSTFAGHVKNIIIATIALVLCSRMNKTWIDALKLLILPTALMVIATQFFGAATNDAKRQIMGIQPSEFFKVSVIFFASWILTKKMQTPDIHGKRFVQLIALIAIPYLFVTVQSLSMGVIIAALVIMLSIVQLGFVRNIRIALLVLVGVVVLGVSALLFLPESITKEHSGPARWKGRIERYLYPEYRSATTDAKRDSIKFSINDENFQDQHAKIAIALSNGRGVFPGNSFERDILPQAYSDFIYAIIIEETGVLGMVIIPGLYLLLFFMLSRWAKRTKRSYHRLILLGVGLLYTTQAMVNIAVVAGIVPNTGQTLPLISRGGSSLLATAIGFGVCIAITRIIQEEEYLASHPKQTTTPDDVVTDDSEVEEPTPIK